MKICSKCKEVKPAIKFSKDASTHDGFRYHCKLCASIIKVKYREDNHEKLKAADAKRYDENQVRYKANSVKYYAANREKALVTVTKWQAANLEARRIHAQNRRARKREAGGKLSKGIAERLFKLQRGKCACCKKPLGNDYHLDHIMPLALGGVNEDSNIQLLRAKCNMQKHTAHPVEFMQQRGYLI